MPATVYYEEDADLSIITGRKVAIVGYGAQGKAHALNLRDSGVDVRVGLPSTSASIAKAEAEGLRVTDPASVAKEADLVMLLVPDQHHRAVFERDIAPGLEPGNAFFVAHGFSIHFRQVLPAPEIDVAMVAPKAPGDLVRRTYLEGTGTPSLLAVHRDATGNAHRVGLSYAKALGAARAGVLETTFEEETETDLFGEQVVLCGGLTSLITAGFETLVEAGYQPESAYFETLHEVKLIVDLLYEGGMARMRQVISDTAEYGDLTRGPRIITSETRAEMKRILEEIRSGSFASEFIIENQVGRPKFEALRRRAAQHPIEEVGAQLRSMMPWLKK